MHDTLATTDGTDGSQRAVSVAGVDACGRRTVGTTGRLAGAADRAPTTDE